MLDWTWIFMARIDGTQKGFHVLATSAILLAIFYTTWRVYRQKKPVGVVGILYLLWIPAICATFIYGSHESVFNPLYFGHAYLTGQSAQVVSAFSNPDDTTRGLLAVQLSMVFFGFLYLRPFLKLNPRPWTPFISLVIVWLAVGFPVSYANPYLSPGQNILQVNMIEGFYTCTFAIGICGAFK